MAAQDYDVVIIGAGISGINFAYRLKERNPNLTYCILEGRSEIGGTWSLFKYPGASSSQPRYPSLRILTCTFFFHRSSLRLGSLHV